MHNCLILGSGRSGTSMVAGTLSKVGYFMGDNLYPARESNPKGFFEDSEINEINEHIIELVDLKCIKFIENSSSVLNEENFLKFGQRWLARIPVGTAIPLPPVVCSHINKVTKRTPFCFKDPRFSYTLPVWHPFLRDTVFICVFRHPAVTALSIVKECRDVDYLKNVSMNFQRALEIWTFIYRHILEIHIYRGEWLFLHYNQLLNGDGLLRLESFTGVPVDHSFPDPALDRSSSDLSVPRKVEQIYQQLCDLAGYKE